MKTKELSSTKHPDGFEVVDECLYNYNNGVYVGVLVDEDTMKQLVKLQAEHLTKVKRLLLKASEAGRVAHGCWTLHHPNDKQTHVQYIDRSQSTEQLRQRLKMATHAHQPQCLDLVFVADSMQDAKEQADRHFKFWGTDHPAYQGVPKDENAG